MTVPEARKWQSRAPWRRQARCNGWWRHFPESHPDSAPPARTAGSPLQTKPNCNAHPTVLLPQRLIYWPDRVCASVTSVRSVGREKQRNERRKLDSCNNELPWDHYSSRKRRSHYQDHVSSYATDHAITAYQQCYWSTEGWIPTLLLFGNCALLLFTLPNVAVYVYNISITPFLYDLYPTILCSYTKYLRLCKSTDTPIWHDAIEMTSRAWSLPILPFAPV